MQKTQIEMIKELEQSEERYRSLVEMSPFCVIKLDAGKFGYVNQSGLNLFKADSFDQLEDKLFVDFIPPQNRVKLLEIMENASKPDQVPVLYESKVSCIDGTYLEVEMTIGQISYWNKKMIHIIIRNITEVKNIKIQTDINEAIKKNLIPTKSIIEAVTGVLDFICVKLSADAGLLWIVDNQTKILRCVSSWQRDNRPLSKLYHSNSML